MPVGLTLYDVLGIPTNATTEDGSSVSFRPSFYSDIRGISEEGVQAKGTRNTSRQTRANCKRPATKSCRGQVQKRMNIIELRLPCVPLNSY